jgi:hypothetical protein
VRLTSLQLLLTAISFKEKAMLAVASMATSHCPAKAPVEMMLSKTAAPNFVLNIIIASKLIDQKY